MPGIGNGYDMDRQKYFFLCWFSARNRHPKSSLQMEIINLQKDILLKIYKTASVEDFWAKHVLDKYMNCITMAIKLATIFSSTYICENSFSKMTSLKNKYRSRLIPP